MTSGMNGSRETQYNGQMRAMRRIQKRRVKSAASNCTVGFKHTNQQAAKGTLQPHLADRPIRRRGSGGQLTNMACGRITLSRAAVANCHDISTHQNEERNSHTGPNVDAFTVSELVHPVTRRHDHCTNATYRIEAVRAHALHRSRAGPPVSSAPTLADRD